MIKHKRKIHLQSIDDGLIVSQETTRNIKHPLVCDPATSQRLLLYHCVLGSRVLLRDISFNKNTCRLICHLMSSSSLLRKKKKYAVVTDSWLLPRVYLLSVTYQGFQINCCHALDFSVQGRNNMRQNAPSHSSHIVHERLLEPSLVVRWPVELFDGKYL
jgi:hypothetical protein